MAGVGPMVVACGRFSHRKPRFFDTPDAFLSACTPSDCIITDMHPGYCPNCGERVTPYAAGCALCGADLDPTRWQRRVPVRQRLSVRFGAYLRGAIVGQRLSRESNYTVKPSPK